MLLKTKDSQNEISRTDAWCRVCCPNPAVLSVRPRSRHARDVDSAARPLTPVFCSSRNEGSSGYIDENKRTRKNTDHQKEEQSEVRSPKQQPTHVRHPILTPGCCLLSSALQEMKVHPAILMKTIEREKTQITKKRNSPKSEVRSPKQQPVHARHPDSDSCLLTSALQR
jgi:hypothetical protein